MTKTDFTLGLCERLPNLPWEEVDERLSFYIEMIDDRMEEGLPEDEAVAAVGSVDEIAAQILAEIPLSKIVKEKIKNNRKMKAWEIVLLILGFPVWFPILVSLLAITLSLYLVLWTVIVTLWVVFASIVVSAFAGMFAGIGFICGGFVPTGLTFIACSFVCAGLSILMFYVSKLATKGLLILTKKIGLYIKRCFVKKEEHYE